MVSSSPRLVVVSVDGMPPAFYMRPDEFGLKVPNLRRLVAEARYAEAVETIYPSTTYPAHASLITGARPRDHGIYSHLDSRDPTHDPRPWMWLASSIRVPTLWEKAKAHGLTTAALSWPVSVGAPIDWNIPEVWDPHAADPFHDLGTVARYATPGLLPDVIRALGKSDLDPTSDHARSEALIHILRTYRPNLLLAHFVEFDQKAHRFGPFSPEALAAIESADRELGRVQDAMDSLGAPDGITLAVLSDHGFVPVSREAAPTTVLKEVGLFGQTSTGELRRKELGAIHAGGCFAVYWLEEPDRSSRRALEGAVDRLLDTGAVAAVVDRDRLAALGADPDAELILEAARGFYFSNRFDGETVREPGPDRGAHGYLPETPGLAGSFLLKAPHPESRGSVGKIHITSVFQFLLAALDLESEAHPADGF